MSLPVAENYQGLANSMNEMLYARVAAATPVEVLSMYDDKLLQVVEEADGRRFVTRSYTPEAVRVIEGNYGLDFRTAWEAMHEAFSGVGIDIVPSRLIETDGEHPFVVVSEYLDDGESLSTASTKDKIAVANGLGKLLATEGDYVPAPEMVREDMFMVVQRDGKVKVLLADIDPLMAPAYLVQENDNNSWFLIDRLAGLAWDKWCNEDERIPVTSALVSALGDYALDRFDFDSRTTQAFMDLHLMSNGVDNRSRRTLDSSTTDW